MNNELIDIVTRMKISKQEGELERTQGKERMGKGKKRMRKEGKKGEEELNGVQEKVQK